MKKYILIFLCLTTASCSVFHKTEKTQTVILRPDINELELDTVPGTVNDVWSEPMYDTIRVPGKLDPKGVYYRKAHNTVVEVRQGQYQMQEYPEDQGSTK